MENNNKSQRRNQIKESAKKTGTLLGKVFQKIVIGIAVVAVSFILIHLTVRDIKNDNDDQNSESTKPITVVDVRHTLRNIDEVATIEDTYSGHIDVDDGVGDSRYLLNTNLIIPGTKNGLGMKHFEGTVKAGYDINEIIDNTSVNQSENTIIVKLPAAEILSNELDETKTVYSEEDNILHHLKGEYYTELETVAKSQGLEQSIKDHALYAKAESNIKNVITDSLSIFDGYTVKFE